METKFQTSFIPKKSTPSVGIGSAVPGPRKHTSSIYMTIATVLFILSILGTGGVYGYKQYLMNMQTSYKQDLATREKQFNTNLIEQLKGENIKIDDARQLLSSHLALSQIFNIIGSFTTEDVRFISMDLTAPSKDSSDIKINLQGYGTNLSAVAFQSDVLGRLDQYGLRNVVKNPILSNPSLGSNGAVSFGFTAEVNPDSLSYEKSISPSSAAATTDSTTSSGSDTAASASTTQTSAQSGDTGTLPPPNPNPFNSQ